MPPIKKKSDLPQKVCVTCGKPYTWRKKWAHEWPQVKYCSEKCRRKPVNPQVPTQTSQPASADANQSTRKCRRKPVNPRARHDT